MNGFSVVRRGGMLAAVAVGFAMLVGGCSATKKKAALCEQENAELREKISGLEAQAGERQSRISELEGRISTMSAAPAPVQPNIGYQPPMNDPTGRPSMGDSGVFQPGAGGRPTATISGDVLFDSGKATLKTSAKKSLDRIAGEIRRNYARAGVRVEGYTDTDPIRKSTWGSNEALSQARADAVRNYLAQKGLSESRLDAVGMGSANPKSSKAASRRVEIVILN